MVPKKRFKRHATSIEDLPNELFLEFYIYLTHVDAVCAFGRLNQRFQSLTLNYCDTFDFKSVSKAKFDYVIRHHNIHQWRSLRLSDDDQTPGQITHVFQLFPIEKYLSQLQDLSIINMKCKAALIILPQLPSLTHLVSLSIGSVCGKVIPSLQLPSLKQLNINSCMHTQWMKNLELTSLQHSIEHHCTHDRDLTWPKTLRHLKIFFSRSGDNDIVRISLRSLSQLITLTVNDSAWQNPPPDGQIWEELISSFMPLLKKFHFCFKFWKDFNANSDITRIVSTFSTPFYLHEKSWFIQCDSHHQPLSVALLYSLPYAFQRFDIVTDSFDESVTNANPCLINNVYKNVRTVTVDVKCQKMNVALLAGHITHLNLTIPGAPVDWIYSLNHLCQLSLENHLDLSSKNFIRLLDNTPHLRSLIIPYHTLESLTDQWKSREACMLLSRKIRSLNIYSSGLFRDYVKVNELVHLVRIFHKRCQYLNISVYSRNIVAGLILRNMRYLRSLHVRLKEQQNNLTITKTWLIEQNIACQNLDCSIVVDGNEYSFWFGSR